MFYPLKSILYFDIIDKWIYSISIWNHQFGVFYLSVSENNSDKGIIEIGFLILAAHQLQLVLKWPEVFLF